MPAYTFLPLGGSINGISPKQTAKSFKSSDVVMTRRVLRSSWNTIQAGDSINGRGRVITPFRAVNNLGDYLGRKNYVCGGSNQTNADKPGWKGSIGAIMSRCDNSGIDASVTNNKFVPDASDYITFKKQRAINQTYNDTTFVGDNSHASYHADLTSRR